MLTEARRLYWDGQSRRARGVYEKLMFDFPKQPEAPAELGNLLMQSGNLDAAVWAYQNAIERYLNLQREQEAITLVDSISRIDPAIAESLQKKYW
jgi:tetratricopeptide (TPR) repeat protein